MMLLTRLEMRRPGTRKYVCNGAMLCWFAYIIRGKEHRKCLFTNILMSYLISKDASQHWQAPSLIMTQRKEDASSPGVVPFAGKSQGICHSGARFNLGKIWEVEYRFMNDYFCILAACCRVTIANHRLYQCTYIKHKLG